MLPFKKSSKCQKLQIRNKEESQKQRLLKMQKPTDLAIKEQVLVEVNEKLCQVYKSKNKKRKERLAQMIANSAKEAKLQFENAPESIVEEGEELGLIIRG